MVFYLNIIITIPYHKLRSAFRVVDSEARTP